jgi:GNAT superfamily N-acetyltransferase
MSRGNRSAPTAGPPPIPIGRRIVEGLRWRMRRVGLHIYPYVAVQEGVEPVTLPALPEPLRAGWTTVDSLDALDALWQGAKGTTRALLLKRFQEGHRCFALWEGETVLAATWCSFSTITHPPDQRPLAEHEVYLFDAFVAPASRGQNLAPQLRSLCYEACRALGRSTMFSFTAYFNTASHRFKAKLGARRLYVAVKVSVLGRWSRRFIIHRYKSG